MISSLKKDIAERFKHGGAHLGAVRRWIQHSFHNGSQVTWGSMDQLAGTGLSVRKMERLAEEIKDAVLREVEKAIDLQERDATVKHLLWWANQCDEAANATSKSEPERSGKYAAQAGLLRELVQNIQSGLHRKVR
jgi:hypothetical protein